MKLRLDDAIDRVAARMTAVEEDDALAARIASALPERSIWFTRVWISRFAMGALATLAIIVVLRPFGDPRVGPAEAGRHSVSVTPAEVGNVVVAPAEVGPADVASAFRRTRIGGTTIASDQPDHEFSLPAIGAVAALDVDALAPTMLPEDAPLTVEPLVIADLPMTADFSPR